MSEVKFKPFQRVLVRNSEDDCWRCDLYSHFYTPDNIHETISGFWSSCIPYNDESAHLLGTTDSPTPPEPEFKWGDKVEVRNDKYNDWKKALFCNRNGGLNMCLAIGDSVVTGGRRCRHADW